MSVSATITVVRDEDEIEVELTGYPEYFGSYNPHERGVHIGDWDIDSPRDIKLTPSECDDAIEALERNI